MTQSIAGCGVVRGVGLTHPDQVASQHVGRHAAVADRCIALPGAGERRRGLLWSTEHRRGHRQPEATIRNRLDHLPITRARVAVDRIDLVEELAGSRASLLQPAGGRKPDGQISHGPGSNAARMRPPVR